MVSFISKFLFTATVTAPTFLSLGLIGVITMTENSIFRSLIRETCYNEKWSCSLNVEIYLQK